MKVWLLYDRFDRLEGVYSEAAKEVREQQFYEEALQRRESCNATITKEVEELKEMRKPYLAEAERLLEEERVAKEINHTGRLKEAKKARKVALRQADILTARINSRETKINDSMLMMKKDLIATYGIGHRWQEEYVMGVE